ncbi:MAG: DUF4387 family protein [Ilumatobacteraceae bacterium]
MATLADVTEAIKSANAGASWITFDIVFADDATYRRVCRSGVVDRQLIGRLYRVDPGAVVVHECDAVRTIKATIPRRSASGGRDETDFDGVQQFAPLLTVDVGE